MVSLKKNRSAKGFTLIEVMIVVATIGLLAAISVPNFQQARTTAQTKACLNNLAKIDSAKDLYALENNVTTGTTPSDSDLNSYLKGGITLAKKCPAGGSVSINAIGSNPSCTISGHSSLSTASSSTSKSPFTFVSVNDMIQ